MTLDEAVLDAADPMLGRVVGGKYRVVQHIGSGGMGSVYRAEHIETGGPVAVKVMVPDRANRPTAIKRFALEAQNAAALRHANTVRVLDFGSDDERMFLVMEFLEGESVEALLERQGFLPAERAARLARQVLSALWEAHEHPRRIVHRDIKPANVFLCRQVGGEDFVKVVDFGVARSLEGSGAGTQGAIGTPAAMAPEQWQGEADPRSDLYAVGCLLYELLTGRPPFVATSGASPSSQLLRLAQMHMHDLPPPVAVLAPRTPVGIARVVHALLEKAPEGRPQTAREAIELLDRALAGDPVDDWAGAADRAEATDSVRPPPRRAPSSGMRMPAAEPVGRSLDDTADSEELPLPPRAGAARSGSGGGRADAPGRPVSAASPPAAAQAVPGRSRSAVSAVSALPQVGPGEGALASGGVSAAPRAVQGDSGAAAEEELPWTRPSALAAGPAVGTAASPGQASAPQAPAAPVAPRAPAASSWFGWLFAAVALIGAAAAGLWWRQHEQAQVTSATALALPPPVAVPALPGMTPPPTPAPGQGPASPEEGGRMDEEPDGRRPQVVYRARLSAADRRGKNGAGLRSAADIIVQDRANVHEGRHRDPGDGGDALFASTAERARLKRLLSRALSREVSKAIVAGPLDVEVQVWRDYVQVALVRSQP